MSFPDSVFESGAVGSVDAAGSVLAALEAVHPDDPLDRYVEAHVHGVIRLRRDVEALVLDPSFRATHVERAARASGLPVDWHPGYALDADRAAEQATYRGADIAAAAARIARSEPLTPAVLAAALEAKEVDAFTAKRVWHLLAAFGRPR